VRIAIKIWDMQTAQNLTHHTVHWMEWKWVSQCRPSKDPEEG